MVPGGSLRANDPTYVVRKQDIELFENLLAGEYCYVFNARQMGKSSMRVRVMKKLRSQGGKCIPIDMTRLGVSIKEESWYEGFLGEIFYGCDLPNSINYQDWRASHQNLNNIQLFARFIEEILFVNFPYPQKIYIFLDEIDVLVKLPLEMRNDFFAFIRSCYNRRAEEGKCNYHRLIFAFVGVATPDDLIRDPKRTPFNIGHPIELTELKFEDGKNLIKSKKLDEIVEEPEVVLKKVFDWTGGQPFLTQKLCQIIVDYAEDSEPDVDQLVEEHILTYWEEKDNPTHFKYMHDYLVNHVEFAPQLLGLYQEILQKGEVETDDSPVQMALRLSGIVIKREKKLVVFNKIYRKIFNEDWVEEKLAEKLANLENNLDNSQAKPQAQPKTLGMSLGIAGLVGVGVIILRTLGLLQSLELNEYDRLMRWRPSEEPDPRLLIVEATATDINKYGISNSLTDDNLAKVIAKLETHQPAIIGLDYLREKPLPSESGYQKLLTLLSNNEKIVAVCRVSDSKNEPSTKPPKGVSEKRLGFIDLLLDPGQINIVRRHYMFQNKILGNPCQTQYSLSVSIALNYLETKGIEEEDAPPGLVKIGQVFFKDLVEGQGFYQKIDTGGIQVLLNYRNSDEVPNKVAKFITISDVLDNNFDASLVKNKIVLIGNTDPDGSDNFYTPYSFQVVSQKQMPGVIVHAHQVSQIISSVLDGRPLITFWHRWADWFWILGWSAVGGVVGWRFNRVLFFLFFIGGNIMILYLVSLIFLTHGFVVSLVPSVLVLVITGVSVFINFERSPPQLSDE